MGNLSVGWFECILMLRVRQLGERSGAEAGWNMGGDDLPTGKRASEW